MPPLGLYLDFPFCISRCAFCNFDIQGYRPAWSERYLAALHREIDLSAGLHVDSSTVVTSLYLGGGTPTLHAPAELAALLEQCKRTYPVAEDTEVTLEAHPATVNLEKMKACRAVGINRLSIGIQSLSDEMLRLLGRHHTAAEARSAFEAARLAGFDNIAIDLIFALPGTTLSDWQETVSAALSLGPDHLSLYALSIEEGTLFHRKGVIPASDDVAAAQYRWAQHRLADAGYLQYEISNFARPGMACRHNRLYWDRDDTIGFGLAASSYVQGKGWENPDILTTYLDAIEGGRLSVSEAEIFDEARVRLDRILFGLRKSEGIPVSWMAADSAMWQTAERLVNENLLERTSDRIRLTPRGMLLADPVAVALMPDGASHAAA